MREVLFYRHGRLDHAYFVAIEVVIKGFIDENEAPPEKPLKALNQYLNEKFGLCHANDFYYIYEKLNDYKTIMEGNKKEHG